MKILIIENLHNTLLYFEQKFKEEGYLLDFVKNYKEATEKLLLYEYDCLLISCLKDDLIVLDFIESQGKLTKLNGLIIVSPSIDVAYKVSLFNMGVDDFLSTPFHFDELNARIHAVVRRRKFNTTPKLNFGNLVIEFHSKKIFGWDKQLDFTKKEYEILLHLIGNKDKVLSKVALAEYLWGDTTDTMDSFNIIAAHIKNIRRKLTEAKAEIEIKNSYGVGYQIIEL